MSKPLGYILYQNQDIVCIMTFGSKNIKTGSMIQTWILLKDISPTEAVKNGKDAMVCGDCKHRGAVVDGVRIAPRTCYVNVGQAPLAVWKAYHAGKYVQFDESAKKYISGKKIRIGSYGDPTFVPVGVWEDILKHTSGHTGYTHQWLTCSDEYKSFLMASCDNEHEQALARTMGWRCFIVNKNKPAENTITCLSSSVGKTCEDCLLCSGSVSKSRKDIWIEPHGAVGKKYLVNLA